MTDPVPYSTSTPRLGLPMLFVGQTQKEATVNEALTLIDMIGGGGVLGLRNLTGERWIAVLGSGERVPLEPGRTCNLAPVRALITPAGPIVVLHPGRP